MYDYEIDFIDGGTRAIIPAEKLEKFKDEVNTLCKRYDLSLGHEDVGGAFLIIAGYDDEFMKWFMYARDPNADFKKWMDDCQARGTKPTLPSDHKILSEYLEGCDYVLKEYQ